MESLQSIALGAPPKDPDEGDQRVANVMKILEKGFPEGMLAAVCFDCNSVHEFSLEDTAIMIVDCAWPKCCQNKRMEMLPLEDIPRF